MHTAHTAVLAASPTHCDAQTPHAADAGCVFHRPPAPSETLNSHLAEDLGVIAGRTGSGRMEMGATMRWRTPKSTTKGPLERIGALLQRDRLAPAERWR